MDHFYKAFEPEMKEIVKSNKTLINVIHNSKMT